MDLDCVEFQRLLSKQYETKALKVSQTTIACEDVKPFIPFLIVPDLTCIGNDAGVPDYGLGILLPNNQVSENIFIHTLSISQSRYEL